MDEKDIKNLKGVHFTITDDMKDTMIEMLFTKQILDECELSRKDRKLLEKHFEKLRRHFASEMSARNPMETIILRNYMSNKKEIDK